MLKRSTLAALALALATTFPLFAHEMEILIGGAPVREYAHNGTTYIEAVRGRDFTIRLSNPTPYRVAVALSVDGLNTLDARHTDPWQAAKWVLAPYESVEIPGWQVSDETARHFYFTGERQSYGAKIGKTQNLGIIEAVFFRERRRYPVDDFSSGELHRRDAPPAPRSEAPAAGAMPMPQPSEAEGRLSDDYAATGMGQRDDHSIEEVAIDLERQPVASVAIRYEFRPALVKLGVLSASPSRLERRERSRGFEKYCPEPD
jgi:hypothetical protein